MFAAGSWPSIILLYAYGVIATSIVTQSVPVIGDISKAFGLSHTEAGWIISIPSLVTAIAALLGGWLVDRIGDRKVIFAGCLCVVAGNLTVFQTHDFNALLAGRLLEGIGYLSLTVGAVTMIMRTTTGIRRSTALGLWTSHTAVGIGATLLIVAPLAQHGEAWRWAFGGHAILLAILAAAVTLLPPKDANLVSRRLADIWTVVRSLKPYRVALASCASAFLQTGIMAALTVFLSRTYQVSIPTAAGIGTASEVVNAIGCLMVGPLLKRGYQPMTLAFGGGAVLLAGAVCLYLPGVSFEQAAIGVAVFSFGIGITNGLIWALVPFSAPSASTMGATSGLVAQATYLGVLLGPPAIFSTFHENGWTTRIMLVVAAAILQVMPLPIWGGATAGLSPGRPAQPADRAAPARPLAE